MRIRLLMTAAFGGLLAACSPPGAAQDCPSVEALRNYRPPEATRVFAMDGSLLADLSPERRVVVDLDEVPPVISNGFVAVEDRRFWQHDGVDERGALRAIVRNVQALSLAEGFSTITMQLPRNIFPDQLPRSGTARQKLARKACEIRLAGQIEQALGKREILKLYINQVYLGDGKYGVEEAARGYFGKAATRLSTAEAALLIGLVKNPEGYNPRRSAARAIQRRNVVLDVLVRENVVKADDAAKARAEPLKLVPPLEAAGPAPYFVAAVRHELRERFGEDAATRGLRVHTSLDPATQRAARDALVEQIARIEGGAFGRWRHPRPDSGRIPPAEGSGSPYLQGAIVVMDTRTGEVRALVGGRDFVHSSYDRALLARRQPGSTFKPIVFATAFERGMSPATMVETTPVSVELAGVAWRPDDLVPDSVTSLTARDALALSSNNGAVRVGEWACVRRVAEMAKTLGLSTPVPPYPSVFLGSAEVMPVELAVAYATLGNGGHRVTPTLIARIEDARGNVLWRAPRSAPAVLDPGVAYLTTTLLEDGIDRGTGQAVRREGFWLPAAGKTGTTNDAKDVWFVGMTPDLVAAVWLGFDQPKEILPNAFGGNLVAPIWARTMKAAYANRAAPAGWEPPSSLVAATIDATTGGLATDKCPPENVRVEHFIPGTEPLEHCPVHGGDGVLGRVLRGLRIR
jgi:penicillin-binding protein 1A